ncbi:ComEC/Rec2 family competence protein [Pseudomonas viridiflava]|uniref:ComEC/Rec2 family competence protein n=1 Tax=Pseudomonas viridiflava TaxID=33069 RepID=UPI001C31201E|nr:MBL fold metallo-hydrolase [Pseudomonas viridiflava]QXG46273.1 MBL fold metallo-hydrolase [Pseudomonas viridiflava]
MVTVPPSTPQLTDELKIHAFGVGHGDCFLVELQQAGKTVFRMLNDAGKAGPHVDSLIAHLKANKRTDDLDIDLVVLSHVDADHQGGLHQLFADKSIRIGAYWGPCLPAFRRARWLFSHRVQHAVDSAALLESAISTRAIPIIYPLEGHTDRWVNGQVMLSVISPAARLLNRLLYGSESDLKGLMDAGRLPLEWLVGPAPREDGDVLGFDLRHRTFSEPNDFPSNPPSPSRELNSLDWFSDEAVGEPNFFGNRVLNDTSLVIALDVWLDGTHRRRVLLTGDQENWAYIASRHPAGLGVDVLKAPHHGGMVYLADRKESDQECKDAGVVEQTYLWLRPRIAIVSASGTYNLPHNRVRDALRAVGAAVMCTNVRGVERITPPAETQSENKCCHKVFECSKNKQPMQSVLTLTRHAESMDRPACVSDTGARGATPIVVMTQRLVEPDETFLRWTSGELENHAVWLRGLLEVVRRDFESAVNGRGPLDALQCEPVPWRVLASKALLAKRRHFLDSPSQILQYARTRGMIWSSQQDLRNRYDHAQFYAIPKAKDLKVATAFVRAMPNLAFHAKPSWASLVGHDKLSVLSSANTESLLHLLAVKLCLPKALVEDEVMPHVLQDMVDHFHFRICRLENPRYSIDSDSEDLKLLYLSRNDGKAAEVPNLFDEDWKSHVPPDGYRYLSNENLSFVLDETQKTGLLGPLFTVHSGRLMAATQPFKKFVDILHYYYEHKENSTFATAFKLAVWRELKQQDVRN